MLSQMDPVAVANFLLSLATLGTAIFAIRGASRQLKQLEHNRVSELRPYVTVRYILIGGKSPAAKLQLHNSGRTSARNIKLDFSDDRAWHYLKNPIFSFRESGLSVLNPGETIEFFMGKIVAGSNFEMLREKPIRITVTYSAGVSSEKFLDTFESSLGDHRYAIKISSELQS